jgi:hypothetical protein
MLKRGGGESVAKSADAIIKMLGSAYTTAPICACSSDESALHSLVAGRCMLCQQ